MNNEAILYNLCQSNDPNSILVAHDLAMELDCGLPNKLHNGASFNVILSIMNGRWGNIRIGIDNNIRSWAGKDECARASIGTSFNTNHQAFSGKNCYWASERDYNG